MRELITTAEAWYPSAGITEPLNWEQPADIIVQEDLFEDQELLAIQLAFGIMSQAKDHIFHLETACSERLLEVAPLLHWPPNIWVGVTVRSIEHRSRILDLSLVPAIVRYVHVRTLQGPVPDVPLDAIEWVLVDGCDKPEDWLRDLRDECVIQGSALYIYEKDDTLELDGQTWSQFPDPIFSVAYGKPMLNN